MAKNGIFWPKLTENSIPYGLDWKVDFPYGLDWTPRRKRSKAPIPSLLQSFKQKCGKSRQQNDQISGVYRSKASKYRVFQLKSRKKRKFWEKYLKIVFYCQNYIKFCENRKKLIFFTKNNKNGFIFKLTLKMVLFLKKFNR